MTSVVSLLEEAGVLVELDDAFQHHVRFTPGAAHRERRFHALQVFVRKLAHDASGVLPLRLVALDLISPGWLLLALAQRPFRHNTAAMLDWKVQVGPADLNLIRWDRREISNSSVLAFSHFLSTPDKGLADALNLLSTCPGYTNIPADRLMDELHKDLCVWAVRNLTGPMWAHITSLRHIWALDRISLAREHQPLVPPASATSSSDLLDSQVAFEFAARGATSRVAPTAHPTLLDRAVKKITTSSTESDEETLGRWFGALIGLKFHLPSSDVNTAILLCWMVDLVESGTLGKPNARIVTRARYMRNLAVRMWVACQTQQVTLTSASSSDLYQVYSAVLADPTATDPVALRSALASFQSYSVQQWGLPFIPVGPAGGELPQEHPRVQIVHNHEAERVLEWLHTEDAPDKRLCQVARALFALLWVLPMRLEEAHQLQIRNLVFNVDNSVADIEILDRSDRPLKNTNSIRRNSVLDGHAIAILSAWSDKRKAEGAMPEDYLFGGKDGDELYRPAAVQSLLRSLVQAATGDPRMTLYALRHSGATRALVAAADVCNDHDYNVFAHVAYLLGHGSVDMTFRFYIHKFESQLRREIDGALRPLKTLTSAEGSLVAGVKANTLVQTAKRRKLPIHLLVEQRLRTLAQATTLPSAVDTSDWETPVCPPLGSKVDKSLTPRAVFELIAYWHSSTALSDAELANLLEISSAGVFRVRTVVLELANAIHARRLHQQSKDLVPVVEIQHALKVMRLRPSSLLQGKYHSLRASFVPQPVDELTREAARAVKILLSKPGYLRLDRPRELFVLLELLRTWKIDSSHLLVCTQPVFKGDTTAETRVQELGQTFAAVLLTSPSLQIAEFAHPGRPAAYLLWPSAEGARDSHAVDPTGLICALWCVHICVEAENLKGVV